MRGARTREDILGHDNIEVFIHDAKVVRTLEDLDSILDSVRRHYDFEDPERPELSEWQQRTLLYDVLIPRGITDIDFGHNKVVSDGLEQIGNLFLGKNVNYPTHTSVGTSTQAVVPGDNALIAEVVRVAITRTFQNGAVSNIDTLFTEAQGNGSLNEVGLHWSASGTDNMFSRRIFTSTKVKTSGDTMTVKWDYTWASVN